MSLNSTAPLLDTAGHAPHSASRLWSLGLPQRLALFALLSSIEWIPISSMVHPGRGAGALLQVAIVSVSLLLAISYVRFKDSFEQASRELRTVPVGWAFLGGHAAAFLAFIGLSLISARNLAGAQNTLVAALWFGFGCLAISLAGCAFVPPKVAARLARITGYAWVYALIAGLIARWLVVYSTLWNGAVWNPALDLSWKPATDFTFRVVQALLTLLLPNVIADRATMTIGTPAFNVLILPWCAGFEGTALMLVFGIAWLGFFRREYRFPHALLLIPAGMAVMWASNAIRITALILIGVAGAPDVAVGGFHSQAGWIAFTSVALGFTILSRRIAWVTRDVPERAQPEAAARNPTAAYLMPFLAILAAGMIASAASGAFEWLYPLRLFAAAGALWWFRAQYLEMDWRFGWFSGFAGLAVFGIWIALDRFAGSPANNGIASGLASLPPVGRIAWLAFRTAAAVVTVPIAEELAFRGFLIRRLISAEFESLSPRQYTALSICISSVAFGVLHGGRWPAGVLAGLIYALVFLRRGRIGDAVVAHGTTNALLAVWVLLGGRWYLW